MPSFLYALFTAAFAFVCVFMILLILIQKGRGGGLSSAFGGAGGNTAFGSKTGDVLTWVTAATFGLFVTLAMALIWTGDWANARANALVTADGTTESATEDDEAIDNDDLPADVASDEAEGDGGLTVEPEAAPQPPAASDNGDDGLIE